MPRAPVLKVKHATEVRERMLAGYTQAEIARDLGITEGTVHDTAPRISSLTSQDRITYHLNRFIRRRGLDKSAEEVEALLHATIEDYMSVKAKALGVKWHHIQDLLHNLPELRLTRREVVRRELLRLHRAGVPIHNTFYMHNVHGNLLERARNQFGNYWIALHSIGVKARSITGGMPFYLNDVAKPLTPLQEAILHMRLAGVSYHRIASVHSLSVRQLGAQFDRLTDKIPRDTDLARRLAKLDKSEKQIREMETPEPPSRESVLDAFIQGKAVYRIKRETGLRENNLLAYLYSFTRAEKRRILEAAKKREKAVEASTKLVQRAKARQPIGKVAG